MANEQGRKGTDLSRLDSQQRIIVLINNTLFSTASSVLWQLLAFVSLPLLISTVGTTDFGIYALAAASVGYFSILSLPARQAVVKFISESDAGNAKKINHVLNSALVLNGAAGLLVAGILVLLAMYADYLVGGPGEGATRARILLLAYAMTALFTQPLSVFASLLYGFQQYAPIAVIDGIGAMTRFATVLLIYFLDGSIFWFVAHEILFEVVKGLGLAFIARNKYSFLKIFTWDFNKESLKDILHYGGWSVLYALALAIIYHGNRIAIGILLSVSMITYFYIGYTLYNLVNTAASYFRTAVLPSSSAALADGDHAFVKKLTVAGSKICLSVMLPVCAHMLIFTDDIIGVWMGSQYIPQVADLSRMLIGSWVFILPSFILVHVYWAQKDIAPLSVVAFVGAVCEMFLLVILVKQTGLNGAALATLVYFILLSPLQLWISIKKIKLGLGEFLAGVVFPVYAICLIYAFGVYFALEFIARPGDLLQLVSVLSISTLLNILLCFLTVSRREGLMLKGKFRGTVQSLVSSRNK